MMKRTVFLLILIVLNGILTYGWLGSKTCERNLRAQLDTLPPFRERPAREESVQSLIFPWKNRTHLTDTRTSFEALFKNALQSDFVWSPDIKPCLLRDGATCCPGHATAFFFYPHVRPFLEALAHYEAPLWVRSLSITRSGLNNACLKIVLVFEAVALDATMSVSSSSRGTAATTLPSSK